MILSEAGESIRGSEKKREIPDFRSPEVGVSVVVCVLLGEMSSY